MFLEKLKLQLFAESEENQEAADLGTDVETEVIESQQSEKEPEVATPVEVQQPVKQPQRDLERDSAFASMRRAMEQTNKQNEMLAAALKNAGFKGNTPEEVIDNANAYNLQIPVEEVRRRRIEAEKRQQVDSQRESELEFYKNRELERIMADDLQKIQKLDPTVKSLDELGDEYFNLIKAGVEAEIAFGVVQQKKQRETKIPPAEVGKVNSNSKPEKDYYSPEEVDKLTEKELENPKIWEVVRKSMTKWK